MKISIITPSFNSGKYIERAIQSVLSQDYDNWEHIIVDGGSTDGTVEILKKYDHLKWISQPDKGQSDAMNKGFEMSIGDLIVYLNADDEFEPSIFSKVVDFFCEQPKAKFLYGDLVCVNTDKTEVRDNGSKSLLEILRYWPCRFPLNSLCYVYKREVQDSIGSFPVNNHFTMDYWFLLRVYKLFEVNYLPEVFGRFYYLDNKSSDVNRAKESLREVRNDFLINNPLIAILFFIINIKSWVGYFLFHVIIKKR